MRPSTPACSMLLPLQVLLFQHALQTAINGGLQDGVSLRGDGHLKDGGYLENPRLAEC